MCSFTSNGAPFQNESGRLILKIFCEQFQSGACGCRSIEISSPRLHSGRAACYGSTIVPLLRYRVMQEPPAYQCSWICWDNRWIAARQPRNVPNWNIWTCQAAQDVITPSLIKSHLMREHLTLFKEFLIELSYQLTTYLITPLLVPNCNIQTENIDYIFQILWDFR